MGVEVCLTYGAMPSIRDGLVVVNGRVAVRGKDLFRWCGFGGDLWSCFLGREGAVVVELLFDALAAVFNDNLCIVGMI